MPLCVLESLFQKTAETISRSTDVDTKACNDICSKLSTLRDQCTYAKDMYGRGTLCFSGDKIARAFESIDVSLETIEKIMAMYPSPVDGEEPYNSSHRSMSAAFTQLRTRVDELKDYMRSDNVREQCDRLQRFECDFRNPQSCVIVKVIDCVNTIRSDWKEDLREMEESAHRDAMRNYPDALYRSLRNGGSGTMNRKSYPTLFLPKPENCCKRAECAKKCAEKGIPCHAGTMQSRSDMGFIRFVALN